MATEHEPGRTRTNEQFVMSDVRQELVVGSSIIHSYLAMSVTRKKQIQLFIQCRIKKMVVFQEPLW